MIELGFWILEHITSDTRLIGPIGDSLLEHVKQFVPGSLSVHARKGERDKAHIHVSSPSLLILQRLSVVARF
jgi:hypothetical protein